jgi:tRNA dimethylallyltransferase
LTSSLPRALAIVGPTASGKSRLAWWLAQRFGLPVLGCDSVQVYRGLDIGSAKPEPALRGAHRLIDLVAPDEAFSAGDYAAAAVRELGSGPGLFAGGTGFYLRAAAYTHSGDEVGDADEPGRAAFTATWQAREREAAGSVHAALLAADPVTAAEIHPRNVVRAVRALWLCEAHGQPVSGVRAADPPRARMALALVILDPPQALLAPAIDARCDAMMRAGFLAEVEMLREAGYSARHKSMRSLGYRQLDEYLDRDERGESRLADAVAAIKAETRSYARRQRTFFRHQLRGDAYALRVTVTAPLWEPSVDLSRETAAWLGQVEAFLSGVSA